MINLKNSFHLLFIGVLFCVMLLSCNRKDVLYSPDKSKKILISTPSYIWIKKPTFRIYYKENDTDFAEIAFSDIGTIEINWQTKPIQVRSYYFLKSTINNDNIECFKLKLDDTINSENHWEVYDMVRLSKGLFY